MVVTTRSAMHSRKPEDKNLWVSKKGFYMLWFEYLTHSPSYELARQFRAGTLSADDKQTLPADFDRVLAVYDDFGDVQRQQFLPWWSKTGMQICAFQSSKPRVKIVAALPRNKPNLDNIKADVGKYITKNWQEEGHQNTYLVAIPVGMTKAGISKQIGKFLDKIPKERKKIEPQPPKYALQGKRQNSDMLFRYMHVLRGRAAYPKMTLWRVGARTRVSDTYSRELEYTAKVVRNEGSYDRSMLAIITSRAILRGKLIAENAARGEFPSYAACPHAVEPDLRKLLEQFNSRQRWIKAQAKSG